MSLRTLKLLLPALLIGTLATAAPGLQKSAEELRRADLLHRAANHYAAGDFGKAALAFESLLESPHRPAPAVFANLGNCRYQLGDYARALHAFRLAQSLSAGDNTAALPDLETKIETCTSRLGLDMTEQRFGSDFGMGRTGAAAAWWTLLAVIGAALGLPLLLSRRRRQRPATRLTAALSLVAALVCTGFAVHHLAQPDEVRALVVSADGRLVSEAHRSATPLLSLAPGTELLVLETSDRWARVQNERASGWIRRDAIGLLAGR